MLRVDQDLAYVLHLRPYRDNSAIVQFLSKQNGRIDLIVNGLRTKKSPKRALLQPAKPVTIDYQINSSLGNCKQLDAKVSPSLPAQHYFSLQYAHELLLRIIPSQTPSESIFNAYQTMLQKLYTNKPQQAIRRLEIALLEECLSLPDLAHCHDETLRADWFYSVDPEHGLNMSNDKHALSGQQILAFNACLADNANEEQALHAKPLTQLFLSLLIDPNTLKTKRIHRSLTHLHS